MTVDSSSSPLPSSFATHSHGRSLCGRVWGPRVSQGGVLTDSHMQWPLLTCPPTHRGHCQGVILHARGASQHPEAQLVPQAQRGHDARAYQVRKGDVHMKVSVEVQMGASHGGQRHCTISHDKWGFRESQHHQRFCGEDDWHNFNRGTACLRTYRPYHMCRALLFKAAPKSSTTLAMTQQYNTYFGQDFRCGLLLVPPKVTSSDFLFLLFNLTIIVPQLW